MEGYSQAELEQEVMVAPRAAAFRRPDSWIEERSGWWQITTPSAAIQTHNEVCTSDFDAPDPSAVVAKTVAAYHALGVPFRWVVGARCQGSGLAEALTAAGAVCHPMIGLAVDPRAPLAAGALGESTLGTDLEISPVDAATVESYCQTLAEGWALPMDQFVGDFKALMAERALTRRLFLAHVGGRRAGAAEHALLERSGYLGGGLVLPAFRGHGIYRALVAARLRSISEAGRTLAVTQARAATSAPILGRLGFEEVCRFQIFDVPVALTAAEPTA